MKNYSTPKVGGTFALPNHTIYIATEDHMDVGYVVHACGPTMFTERILKTHLRLSKL